MKKPLAILMVAAIFASFSALALVLYEDNSPDPKECKTCVYKAVIGD